MKDDRTERKSSHGLTSSRAALRKDEKKKRDGAAAFLLRAQQVQFWPNAARCLLLLPAFRGRESLTENEEVKACRPVSSWCVTSRVHVHPPDFQMSLGFFLFFLFFVSPPPQTAASSRLICRRERIVSFSLTPQPPTTQAVRYVLPLLLLSNLFV